MRKVFMLILLAVTAFFLFSCGGGNGGATNGEGNNSNTSNREPESKYTFTVQSKNNFEIKIDQDMSVVLEALGEPLSYFEAASCAFEGLDKTYTYAGFTVTTRPDGDKDYVNAIFLTDDSLTTAKGIYIGSTSEEVVDAYGDTERTDTLISYTDGNTMLSFIIKDSRVISIEYIPA